MRIGSLIVFSGIEKIAFSNGSTVCPRSTHPMSPPLPEDDGSSEFARGERGEVGAAAELLRRVDCALARAAASTAGAALGSTFTRMCSTCAASGVL